MQGQIISSTKELLQACANGGEPRRTYDQHLGKDVWHLHTKRLHPVRILANVARSAEKNGYIEPTGLLYWQLTPAGRNYLVKAIHGLPATTGAKS